MDTKSYHEVLAAMAQQLGITAEELHEQLLQAALVVHSNKKEGI